MTTWPPQCHLCFRFISYKDLETAMRWTPYGDTSMDEPPTEEFAHESCWRDAPKDRRSLIEAVAWAKPYSPLKDTAEVRDD